MRRVVFAAVVFAVLTLAPEVRSDPASPSAAELAEKARRASELQQWPEAIDAYERAYRASGEPGLLFGLADVHRRAGHDADALTIFRTYLRRSPKGTNRERAQRQIDELEREERRRFVEGSPVTAPPTPKTGGTAPAASPAASFAPSDTRSPPADPMAPAPVDLVAPPAEPGDRESPAPPAPTASSPSLSAPAPPLAARSDPAESMTAVRIPASSPQGRAPPLPRWVPWVLTASTLVAGTGAILSGLSASHRYGQLRDSCGQDPDGCPARDVDDLKGRVNQTNVLWAITGALAIGAGVTVYLNASAAGAGGLWRF